MLSRHDGHLQNGCSKIGVNAETDCIAVRRPCKNKHHDISARMTSRSDLWKSINPWLQLEKSTSHIYPVTESDPNTILIHRQLFILKVQVFCPASMTHQHCNIAPLHRWLIIPLAATSAPPETVATSCLPLAEVLMGPKNATSFFSDKAAALPHSETPGDAQRGDGSWLFLPYVFVRSSVHLSEFV